jgi:transmembrane sensor
MTPDDPDKRDIALSDEAVGWLVKLNSGRATDADQDAFASWRRQSAAHEAAVLEAEAVWQGVGLAGAEVRDAERKKARAKLTRRTVLGGGAVAIVGAGLYQSGIIGPHLFADYTTAVAEQRTIPLPDGSSAFLNGNTALSADFSGPSRELVLFKGQATFSVAPDPNRPFIVEANGGRARALGTVFDVDIRPADTFVTVVEGTVAVASGASASNAVRVTADQRVRYVARRIPSAPEHVDANAETAWRRGKLIFNNRALGDVVAEIERHRSGRILIASSRLSSLEVTGVFDISDPDAILHMIEETLPVQITRLPMVTVIR